MTPPGSLLRPCFFSPRRPRTGVRPVRLWATPQIPQAPPSGWDRGRQDLAEPGHARADAVRSSARPTLRQLPQAGLAVGAQAPHIGHRRKSQVPSGGPPLPASLLLVSRSSRWRSLQHFAHSGAACDGRRPRRAGAQQQLNRQRVIARPRVPSRRPSGWTSGTNRHRRASECTQELCPDACRRARHRQARTPSVDPFDSRARPDASPRPAVLPPCTGQAWTHDPRPGYRDRRRQRSGRRPL